MDFTNGDIREFFQNVCLQIEASLRKEHNNNDLRVRRISSYSNTGNIKCVSFMFRDLKDKPCLFVRGKRHNSFSLVVQIETSVDSFDVEQVFRFPILYFIHIWMEQRCNDCFPHKRNIVTLTEDFASEVWEKIRSAPFSGRKTSANLRGSPHTFGCFLT
jgi:hypothetical protein